MKSVKTGNFTIWFRLLGFLPLLFFLAHARFYWTYGGLANMLWMCNIGNLMLAAGLFLASSFLIRLAVIWLIPGLPLWFYFVVLQGGWLLTSTLSHVGGLLVGMIALHKVRSDRWTWLYATGWYLILQQICRMFTPADLNVNVAHRPYEGYTDLVSSYWQFWLVTTLMTAIGLWLLGFILFKLVPPRDSSMEPPAEVGG